MTTVFSLRAVRGDRIKNAFALSPSLYLFHSLFLYPSCAFANGLAEWGRGGGDELHTFVPPVVLNTFLLGGKQHLNSELLTAEMKC